MRYHQNVEGVQPMGVDKAYCEELGRVVNIYEARKEFFDLPLEKRKRFHFRCADDQCRAEKNPLIVGVNYDKKAEDSEIKQQPHFRIRNEYPHISSCKYYEDMKTNPINTKGTDESQERKSRAKLTDIIDEFILYPENISHKMLQNEKRNRPTIEDSIDDERNLHLRQSPNKTGLNKTGNLRKLVDCWRNMSPENCKKSRIKIHNKNLRYDQLFLHVSNIDNKITDYRVIYGRVTISTWRKDNPDRYYLDFVDASERLPLHKDDRGLSIKLFFSELKKIHRGQHFIDSIEQSLNQGYALTVYVMGRIKQREFKGYEVEILDLDDHLVLDVDKPTA